MKNFYLIIVFIWSCSGNNSNIDLIGTWCLESVEYYNSSDKPYKKMDDLTECFRFIDKKNGIDLGEEIHFLYEYNDKESILFIENRKLEIKEIEINKIIMIEKQGAISIWKYYEKN